MLHVQHLQPPAPPLTCAQVDQMGLDWSEVGMDQSDEVVIKNLIKHQRHTTGV